jgi:hypothetical protein
MAAVLAELQRIGERVETVVLGIGIIASQLRARRSNPYGML